MPEQRRPWRRQQKFPSRRDGIETSFRGSAATLHELGVGARHARQQFATEGSRVFGWQFRTQQRAPSRCDTPGTSAQSSSPDAPIYARWLLSKASARPLYDRTGTVASTLETSRHLPRRDNRARGLRPAGYHRSGAVSLVATRSRGLTRSLRQGCEPIPRCHGRCPAECRQGRRARHERACDPLVRFSTTEHSKDVTKQWCGHRK